VLWDVATGKQLAFIPAERAPGLISFSRDSRQLVVITQLNDDELGKGMLRVARWNVATQQVVHQEVVGPGVLLWPESLRGRALYVHKQSDGRRLLRDLVEDLTVCRLPSEGPDANDVEIRGWVVGPRGGEVSLTYPDAGGSQLAPTPADPSWLQRLASAIFPINAPTQDAVGRIRFCDVQTGKNLGSMPLAHILFAEDGKSVVLAHSDKTISIWDVPPRRPIPLILLLAFLHTALILAPCWYFARRR
jgi:WD40 repeat protein